MKIVLLFLAIGISLILKSQTGKQKVDKTVNPTVAQSPRIIIRRGTPMPDVPLYIVNGVPVEDAFIRKLNPGQITSISILKDATATAIYGRMGSAGVVLITTRANGATFSFKDAITGAVIPNVTIVATSQEEHSNIIMDRTDSTGRSTIDLNRNKSYSVKMTSVGYRDLVLQGIRASDTIVACKLERDIKECAPVIVTGYGSIRCSRMWWECIVSGQKISGKQKSGNLETTEGKLPLSVFPNPVSRGQALTATGLKSASNSTIKVFAADGHLLSTQKSVDKVNSHALRIPTDSRWTPGTYILQIISDSNLVTSTKFIVQ